MKNILDSLNVNRDDCFEKQDLINRIKEAKEKQSSGGNQQQSTYGGARASSKPKTDYNYNDNYNPGSYKMPEPI